MISQRFSAKLSGWEHKWSWDWCANAEAEPFSHTHIICRHVHLLFPVGETVNRNLSPGPQSTHTSLQSVCQFSHLLLTLINPDSQKLTAPSFFSVYPSTSPYLHSHLLSFCVPLFSSVLGATLVMTCQQVTLKRLLHFYLSWLPVGSSYSRIRHLMQSQTENFRLSVVILGKL